MQPYAVCSTCLYKRGCGQLRWRVERKMMYTCSKFWPDREEVVHHRTVAEEEQEEKHDQYYIMSCLWSLPHLSRFSPTGTIINNSKNKQTGTLSSQYCTQQTAIDGAHFQGCEWNYGGPVHVGRARNRKLGQPRTVRPSPAQETTPPAKTRKPTPQTSRCSAWRRSGPHSRRICPTGSGSNSCMPPMIDKIRDVIRIARKFNHNNIYIYIYDINR